MIAGLLTFLVGALVLAVVIYVFRLVLNMLGLPAEVNQIALLIVSLILLVLLIWLTIQAVQGGGVGLGVPR